MSQRPGRATDGRSELDVYCPPAACPKSKLPPRAEQVCVPPAEDKEGVWEDAAWSCESCMGLRARHTGFNPETTSYYLHVFGKVT